MDKKPLTQLVAIGSEILILQGIFIYLGRELDKYMGWKNIGLVSGAVIALVIWMVRIIKTLNSQVGSDTNLPKKPK